MPDPSKIRALLSGLGYDPRVGAMGSFTYDVEDSAPRTVPLAPFAPGLVLKPKGRDLTDVERAHEGTHVNLGLPGAIGGKLIGSLLGTKHMGARIDPDEALAYMNQPSGPETSEDMKVQASQGRAVGGVYGKILERLARSKQ